MTFKRWTCETRNLRRPIYTVQSIVLSVAYLEMSMPHAISHGFHED